MPVVGFHQARRPRQTRTGRLRRDLSWPRPGGILISLAGAALVLGGALSLTPSDGAPSPAAASSGTSTTPAPAAVSGAPSRTPSAPLPPSDISPSTTSVAPLVAGSNPVSAIQELFASGNGSLTDPALLDIANPESPLVLVNKHRPLVPANFAPSDLVAPNILSGSGETVLVREEAAAAAERMFAAAAAAGVIINVKSSYRSHDTQVAVYNGYVADKGVAAADSTSARPGFSEHQTGLALDIGDASAGTACDFQSCFADTAAARWVAAHGAAYGFVVRYVPGQDPVTGYVAEPWHLRYLGVAVAQDMQRRGIPSYEQYLGLTGAPGYK